MTSDDLERLEKQLFDNRGKLLTLWQSLAENFYPSMADFTVERSAGDEFMENLTTSYPVIARRELGDTLTSMLRPRGQEWFNLRADREERENTEALQWMEWATGTQRRAMYDPLSGFTRATKQGDHDFATFGQTPISVELSVDRSRFLYRHWHLRDVAWIEGADLQISHVGRKWQPTALDLSKTFPGKVHPEVMACIEQKKEPFRKFNCVHFVIPNEEKGPAPHRSIHYDCENKYVMEDVPSWSRVYVIPRWQTVTGSPYAHSPAAVAALPDARLIQAITLTLLDAGEMYAAPPMLAVQGAIRSDIDLRARGITWVDREYDERSGEPLRALSQDARGYPIGAELREEARSMIADAFFLSKLQLPPADGREMTAYEVGQRVQEFIRTTMPLFEPIEADYNAALCDATFDLGLRNGLFGPLDAIPESLRKADVRFVFKSPLSDAIERQKSSKFMETANLLAMAGQVDPTASMHVNMAVMVRDAIEAVAPAKWMATDAEYEAAAKARQEQQDMMQQIQGVDTLASVATNVGGAADALQSVAA
jgi:hypothetical protein